MSWITDYTGALEACIADRFGTLCGWGVVAGDQVSLDFCGGCDSGGCGQWWIAVTSIYPTSTFPGQDDGANGCATPLAVALTVGVARCFPVPEDGDPPTHEQHAEAFAEQMADALTLHRAIACCVGGYDVSVGAWSPLGPDGGCLGGSWTITVTPR